MRRSHLASSRSGLSARSAAGSAACLQANRQALLSGQRRHWEAGSREAGPPTATRAAAEEEPGQDLPRERARRLPDRVRARVHERSADPAARPALGYCRERRAWDWWASWGAQLCAPPGPGPTTLPGRAAWEL